ncbi:MAG: hypothetical protein KGL39_30455 [Patescibacteria group bacterium]|nr:hypothetical protein [Patescibacteria group bacterium]
MKRFWILAALCLTVPAMAQTGAINGFCTQGGVSAVTSGMNSTNKVQGIVPSCTVTVFQAGTTNKATIYADASNTPLSNPFTANSQGSTSPGQWVFWAANGNGYDVVLSGGIPPQTFSSPITLNDLFPSGSGGGGGGGSTGAFFNSLTNYILPWTTTSQYPLSNPFNFQQYQTISTTRNNFIQPLTINSYLLSGYSDWLDQTDNFGNFDSLSGVELNVNTQTPMQIGGLWTTQVNAHTTNDVVSYEANIHCLGISRGDNEGCEEWRFFEDFNESLFTGTVTLNGNDSLGNPKMQVSGSNLGSIGEQRVLYDSSKKWSSPGNIATIAQWGTNSNFLLMTGDGGSNVTSQFGTSSYTTVVGGADYNKYNNLCPSTATGTWGNTDPYAPTAVDGTGTQTTQQCVQLASTTGLTAGTVVAFFGGGSNYEYETVQSVPSPGYIVVNLKRAHSRGEYVFWGGGVGWCFQGNSASDPCYPVAATLASNQILLYNNSAVTFGNSEFKGTLYGANTAPTAMTATLTVTGGVASIASQTPGGYFVGPGYAGAGTGSGRASQNILPAPTPTFAGATCTTYPTFNFSQTQYFGYSITIKNGGTGCGSGLTVSFQTVYPNPFVMYPSTRVAFVINPTVEAAYLANPASYNYSDPSASGGYVVTDPLAASASWANGDTVVQGTWWQKYMGSQQEMDNSLLTSNSQRFGDFQVFRYSGNANNETFWNFENTEPAKHYVGQSANNWVPGNPSLPACTAYPSTTPCYDPLDKQYAPPHVLRMGGITGGAITMDFPPYPDSQGTASVIQVNCQDGAGGYQTHAQCNDVTNQVLPTFNFLQTSVGGFSALQYAAPTQTWSFTSPLYAPSLTAGNLVTASAGSFAQYIGLGTYGKINAVNTTSTSVQILTGGDHSGNVYLGDCGSGFQVNQYSDVFLGNCVAQQTFTWGGGGGIGTDGSGIYTYVFSKNSSQPKLSLNYPNGNDTILVSGGAANGYSINMRTGAGDANGVPINGLSLQLTSGDAYPAFTLAHTSGPGGTAYTWTLPNTPPAAGVVQIDSSGNVSTVSTSTATSGQIALVGGTVTVSTAGAVALGGTKNYYLTHCTASGTIGILSVGTITAGTSFVINSTSATDTSTVCWSIF